ncbi:hypothetical protein D9V30_03335 [Mycetocola reblochoni]|uniref:Uncharacterized protein n=3 Tax=Mycetocola reblochoni TaxID=331618 RepID=A0A1R4JK00_9MICO|nr:hypothetical protein D9V30_03335 [Mycetocola reblochoni]SJN32591.1 hypothetical protein FM119_08045 [Mycetocola reblochoni REB411]
MARALLGCALVASALTGCATSPPADTASVGATPDETGTLPGLPAPGATIDPGAGAVEQVELTAQDEVALIVPADPDEGEQATIDGVLAGLAPATTSTTVVDVQAEPGDDGIAAAADAGPALVVVVGPTALDAVDRVSAGRLERQFLIVGAQLPEPTANVTAVIWPGADQRGAAGAAGAAGTSGESAVADTEAARAAGEAAVTRGVGAALGGGAGFVYALDGEG